MLILDGLNQLGHRIDPNDLALYDEGNASAEPLGLFDVMGGQENGGPGLIQVSDELADLPSAGYIDAGGGFV